MMLVVSQYDIKPDWVDRWPDLVAEFTEATRAEDGNLFFDWSRDLEVAGRFVLVEGFREDAVDEHLASPLVPKITRTWKDALARDPRVLQATVAGDAWGVMPNFGIGTD